MQPRHKYQGKWSRDEPDVVMIRASLGANQQEGLGIMKDHEFSTNFYSIYNNILKLYTYEQQYSEIQVEPARTYQGKCVLAA